MARLPVYILLVLQIGPQTELEGSGSTQPLPIFPGVGQGESGALGGYCKGGP